MDIVSLDSSSEEEYMYTDFAAKYKALKKESAKEKVKKPVAKIEEKKTPPISYSIVIDTESQGKRVTRSQACKQKTLHNSSVELVTRSMPSRSVCSKSPEVKSIVADLKKIVPRDITYNMNVKVLWRSKTVHKLNMYNDETFHRIFQYFADLGKVSEKDILIMHKDHRVQPTDTPAFLQLTVIDILEAGVIQNGQEVCREDMQDDVFNIKVQTAKKESLIIPLLKNTEFRNLLVICAQKLHIEEGRIRLYFDGELIDPEDTPESLSMEREACIDLHIPGK